MKETYNMIIDEKQTTSGLQKEFNEHFPFLKMEFFREPCFKGKASPKDKMIKINEFISRLQRIKQSGKISISNKTIVGELEEKFNNTFGLCMQIFRKSGNIWLETTSTDDWTLEQQNDEGRNLAEHWKIERENPEDHDIY